MPVSATRRPLFTSMVILSFALLAGTTQRASAQSDLNGFWELRAPIGDGTYRDTFFELHQSGEALTGRLLEHGNDGIPVTGTLHGTAVHLVATKPSTPASPRPPIVFDGSFEGGRMNLETHSGRGEVSKGTAERSTKEATLPPAPLPLPAPRVVPDNGLARTPPMGWNSWNKFAGKITDADVRLMADAMVSSGMSKVGYNYINIDDTWELGRDANGNITTNSKFPDMKGLADYVHSKGLKIGIYSSPGPKTCGDYEGSFGHEVQDAKTYAAWGFDYLKYDLCSAHEVYTMSRPVEQGLYQKMGAALADTGRAIVFSMCQYGDYDPWKWGAEVGGNSWRTTGDISDNWKSMETIGFSQIAIASYTRPGHWNDPDMLEVGNGGMTADEYRTHMSLWSMLSAPLLAGNDLRTMTAETKSILMNTEVIAINQDVAAKPTQPLMKNGSVETLWRPMHDGSIIIGIFNRGDAPAPANLVWSSLPAGLAGQKLKVRDLWKHSDVAVTSDALSAMVPTHGVTLLRITKQ